MKLYRTFRMGGQSVMSASAFRRLFQPEDFLRQRELAAGFAMHQMRTTALADRFDPISPDQLEAYITTFAAELLCQCALGWETLCSCGYSLPDAGHFFQKYSDLQRDWERNLLGALQRDRGLHELLDPLWELSGKTGLPDGEQRQLYCLLVCGYLLADTDLSKVPLTPEAARAAYLRTEGQSLLAGSGWFTFPAQGTISLEARETPYRILLGTDAAQRRLEEDPEARIEVRKIVALPHPQGGLDLPLRLEVYTSQSDRSPAEISFLPGDCRWCSFVGSIPVRIHPVSVPLAGGGRMERQNNRIVRVLPDGTLANWSLNCEGREIVSLAVWQGEDLIILEPDRVDYTQYWNAAAFPGRPRKNVAEARFLPNGELTLLLTSGDVLSSWRGIVRRHMPTLSL